MKRYSGGRGRGGLLPLGLVAVIHLAIAAGLLIGLAPQFVPRLPSNPTIVDLRPDNPEEPPELIPEARDPKTLSIPTEVDLPKLPEHDSAPTTERGEPTVQDASIDPGYPITKPKYPAASVRLGEEGRVILNVYVGEDGKVREVRVMTSSGFPRLDQAAIDWARANRWRPATKNGQAVAGWVRVPVVFRLTDAQ